MLSSVIYLGFSSVPTVYPVSEEVAISESKSSTTTSVSILNAYFPASKLNIPLNCCNIPFILLKTELEVSRVVHAWCLVAHLWWWDSQPNCLQYSIKSELYKLYSVVSSYAPSVVLVKAIAVLASVAPNLWILKEVRWVRLEQKYSFVPATRLCALLKVTVVPLTVAVTFSFIPIPNTNWPLTIPLAFSTVTAVLLLVVAATVAVFAGCVPAVPTL